MEEGPFALAHRAAIHAVELLAAASDSSAAPDDVLSALTICEGLTRRLDQLTVTRIGDLTRRGEDLEQRARAAMLDYGSTLTPGQLRLLACAARVVPIVMDGASQPLDVGRAKRVIPDGLRRAVAARDRGCAHGGCRRPPS